MSSLVLMPPLTTHCLFREDKIVSFCGFRQTWQNVRFYSPRTVQNTFLKAAKSVGSLVVLSRKVSEHLGYDLDASK
ncbi:hypothetical protein [Bacillus pakistanensis]|uniref:hypothetical protein n=1 Tax=Rossellomorea pakistanensis TaxID=992288 RepID=UPI0019631FC2|nr:hypothetical protein [Bacillus pakistanensis]